MNKHMILSVGMPRAGSGWYYNLTQDLVIAAGGVDAKIIRSKYGLKGLLTEVNCNLGTLSFYRLLPAMAPLIFEPAYVIKLHAGRRPLADWFIKTGLIKPTFIFRDPRDALLSAYEYGQRMSSQGLTNAFTPLETIEDAIEFMDFYVRVARGWITHPGTLVVKYEDLKGDFEWEASRLVDFLGIDSGDKKIIGIIDQYRPERKPKKIQGLHFVKGKIGRYQDAFNSSQLAMCEGLFGDFLKEHGYE
ncbi:MAG: sulfotransferase domain-containing protein [Anaerolineales bacterium]